MASVQKENDAAPAATDPRHGSTNPTKDMDMNERMNTMAAAGTTRPSLYRLLADYWEKFDLLDLAMQETDAAQHGTSEREAAELRQFEAGEDLDSAVCAIFAYVPVWRFEARLKTDFVSHIAKENYGSLDREWVSALITSMPTLCAANRMEGSAA